MGLVGASSSESRPSPVGHQLTVTETAWASVMRRKAAGHLGAVSENQSHKVRCRSAVGRVGRQSTQNRHPRPRIRRPEAAGQTKATHPKVLPRRRAHSGMRPSGRLLRGALPALRRRAQDHCGDPGCAGNREHPHAPGIAGACTATGSCPWPGFASGLRLPNRVRSGDPLPRAARAGCVRGFAGSVEVTWGQGSPANGGREGRFSAALSTPNRPQPPPKTGSGAPAAVFCRARGAMGKKRGRLKSLSSAQGHPQGAGKQMLEMSKLPAVR